MAGWTYALAAALFLAFAATSLDATSPVKIRHCPAILCSNACKYGYRTEDNGCQTCNCKPNPCQPVLCKTVCTTGYQTTDQACQTCACKPDLCEAKKCPRGEFCEVITAQCFTFPCNPPSTAICRKCPQVRCSNVCKFGFKVDKRGCNTCNCNVNPCAAKTCPKGEVCEVVKLLCLVPPCPPPTAICRKKPPPPPVCTPKFCLQQCYKGPKPVTNVEIDRCRNCKCPTNPCHFTKCGKGQQCEVTIVCENNVCKPRSVCKTTNPCALPKVVGPCKAAHKRYYFNQKLKKCIGFTYGGCGGNANNFKKLQDCVKQCGPKCKPAVCSRGCRYGYIRGTDSNGCPFCRCKPNPCTTKKCPPGTKCQLRRTRCKSYPCFPVAICRSVKPINVCKLPKVVGPCDGLFSRYFFNYKTGKCAKFNYGGCGGNGNNFKTLADCQKRCGGPVPEPNPCEFGRPLAGVFCGRGPTRQDCPGTHKCVIHPSDRYAVCCRKKPVCPPVCLIACKFGNVVDANGCATCKCKPSPCQGHKCPAGQRCELQKVVCVKAPCFPVPVCKPFDVCKLPKVVGRCRARLPRYFFNYKSGKCEKFFYGGCRGNENNFKTMAECRGKCGPKCGPVCLIFCEFGNVMDNGCPTCKCNPSPCVGHKCPAGQQCELQKVVCVKAPCFPVPVCKPFNVCKLPKVVGSCRGAFPRFSFNTKSGQCEQFIYGGCGGNENNFKTMAECRGICGPKCPPVCAIFCEFGNVPDKNGCPTCKCKPSPCKDRKCGPGQFCVVEKPVCKKAPCPPIAVCKPQLPSCQRLAICPLIACGPGQQTCDENSDCGRGQTCCRQCCFTKCVPTRHPGFCPSVKRSKVPAVCKTSDGCRGDFQCPKDHKCCKDGEGCMACVKALTYTYVPKSHG